MGSITHSKSWAATIVAHQCDYTSLGLDLEHLLSNTDSMQLADQILTPMEYEQLSRRAPDNQGWVVTLTFSLKESLFKALYPLVATAFYFEHAELLSWNEHGQARLRLLCDLNQEWQAGREVNAQFCHFHGQLLSIVAIPAKGGAIGR